MNLTAKDRELVSLLQNDAQLTHSDLAQRLGFSQSACHRRVKQLEEAGIISGYRAIVDRKKLGLNVLSYVIVKLESHAEDLLSAFTKQIEQIDEVVACYAISGNGDYILKVIAEDMDAYAELALKKLARLPGVKDSSSNFVLSEVKLAEGWPLPEKRTKQRP